MALISFAMVSPPEKLPAYVVKAADLSALYYLDTAHPRPRTMEWINRGTDQRLRPSTIDMLLRTMFRETHTPSVQKLHDSAGLRAEFRSERERDSFARAFDIARKKLNESKDFILTSVFDQLEAANAAVLAIKSVGVPDEAISLVWRASNYLDQPYEPPKGHSVGEITTGVVGGGIAGALFGMAVLFVPGVGPVAVAGALTASAFGSVAGVSGVIGATGSAIAKMLSDHDVDGVEVGFYEQEIRRGKVFVSVDTRKCEDCRDEVVGLFASMGGRRAES
ncbi:hypothetical protein [Qipengyuania soli]|uniref:DUF1269 domain-containing protein n=1 Tax=Qipengyuania soli TaxID=2782568 RepID=A0A7S8F3N4_9SPHN|nr:hypothetical protein [Qipengyuania soli]QPC99875.1 hypothetical protein IRL76_04875 [Qipengyuania soli]